MTLPPKDGRNTSGCAEPQGILLRRPPRCCWRVAGLLRAAVLAAQAQPSPPATATRPDVAAIDRDRILAAATRYLTQPPTPLTSLHCARSPGSPHDYYSEAGPAALAEGESNAGPSAPAGSGPSSEFNCACGPVNQTRRAIRISAALHRAPRRALHAGTGGSRAGRRASAHRRPALRRARRSLAARMVRRSRNPHDAAPGLRPGRARPTRGDTASRIRGHPGDAAAGRSRAGGPVPRLRAQPVRPARAARVVRVLPALAHPGRGQRPASACVGARPQGPPRDVVAVAGRRLRPADRARWRRSQVRIPRAGRAAPPLPDRHPARADRRRRQLPPRAHVAQRPTAIRSSTWT